ncbi:hypothetical protein, partial [Tenacibaculum agarivorans]|uniref:hypothetical protein n=1 Tax=Tenacibaculum agarivorans TaxID=1908389 RepID=UPI000A963AB1
MALAKIVGYKIDNDNKQIKLYINDQNTLSIPDLNDIEFEVYKFLLESFDSEKITKAHDPTINQLIISGNVDSSYVKGFNINYLPKAFDNKVYNINFNDVNTKPNVITLPDNHLIFLS